MLNICHWFSSANSASQDVCVLMACCQTVKEVVLKRRTVPVLITENCLMLDSRSLWAATRGECSTLTPLPCVLFTTTCFYCGWCCSSIFLNHSTCKGRNWACTENECDGVCTIYGEGHYTTFDQRKFSFNGNCNYVFTQVWHILCSVNGYLSHLFWLV